MTKTLPVLSFAKLDQGMPMPHLLDLQTRAFQSLLPPDGKGPETPPVRPARVVQGVLPHAPERKAGPGPTEGFFEAARSVPNPRMSSTKEDPRVAGGPQ